MPKGTDRVVRGGGWGNKPRQSRPSLRTRLRNHAPPDEIRHALDRWVRALLLHRDDAPPVTSILASAAAPSEFTRLPYGAVAALTHHADEVREGALSVRKDLLGPGSLREALAVLDRAIAPTDPDLPSEVFGILALEREVLFGSLVSLRALGRRGPSRDGSAHPGSGDRGTGGGSWRPVHRRAKPHEGRRPRPAPT